ncbi:MAG: lipid-A-disaccharide synthase-related protein [Elainellaceae cyanobacterium]
MKILCLSNGHGEDAIALRILQALQRQPNSPDLAALPLVGEGLAYQRAGIPLAGAVKAMPSGGFIYMDSHQFIRDVGGGLLQLTLGQIRTVRQWARLGYRILAVGDIVPLLFAWMSGADYAFVGTAKSEYYLRDENGWLPRPSWFERLEGWSGSVYLPWERWLMGHSRCQVVFPRDAFTARILQRWAIPTFDLGNPMMDGLEPTGHLQLPPADPVHPSLNLLLLPGSRAPEAYANWRLILQAVASVRERFQGRSLRYLAAIAPSLDLMPLQQALHAAQWQSREGTSCWRQAEDPVQLFVADGATLVLTQSGFGDCLHHADVAIALAGTATEQVVGLGKPVVTFPGPGPQFTPAFAEAQTRLLGPSIVPVDHPQQAGEAIASLLNDPERLQRIEQNGRSRLGLPGAGDRIARCLLRRFRLSS